MRAGVCVCVCAPLGYVVYLPPPHPPPQHSLPSSTHCHYREALTEVFHRMDLDGNNVISRTEFDFFQERTSGEVCDDDTWKVIQGT